MEWGESRHADQDTLERYSMGRLRGPENIAFEEHLLVCEHCQDALASMDSYVAAMRTAAGQMRREESAVKPWSLGRFFQLPKPAWALGLAAAAVLIVAGIGYPTLRQSGSPAVVVLEANRGPGESDAFQAPSGKPLALVMSLEGAAVFRSYRLEIVDGGGRVLYQSPVTPKNGKIEENVGRSLADGAYLVRLYGGQQQLHEYLLKVGTTAASRR